MKTNLFRRRVAARFGLLPFLTLTCLAGCMGGGDNCVIGTSRCDGDTQQYCYKDDWYGSKYSNTECSEDYQCVELTNESAICAYQGQQYSACADAGEGVCEGDLRISCESGYRTGHMFCLECDMTASGGTLYVENCSANSYYQECHTSSDCASSLECIITGNLTWGICSRTCSSDSDCYDLHFPSTCYSGPLENDKDHCT